MLVVFSISQVVAHETPSVVATETMGVSSNNITNILSFKNIFNQWLQILHLCRKVYRIINSRKKVTVFFFNYDFWRRRRKEIANLLWNRKYHFSLSIHSRWGSSLSAITFTTLANVCLIDSHHHIYINHFLSHYAFLLCKPQHHLSHNRNK